MLMTYKPSGRFSPSVVMLLPLLLAIAIGTAWLYEFLIRLIPLIFLDCLICVGYAGLLTFLTDYALRLAKVRNVPVALVVGLVVGLSGFLAAHYFGYLFDTAPVPGGMSIAEYVKARVQQGFTIGKRSSKTTLDGWVVYAIWGIEACIIVGGGAIGGLTAAQTAFCERCGLWASQTLAELVIPRPGAEAIQSVRQATTVTDALAVEPTPVGSGADGKSLHYTVKGCPGCSFAVMAVALQTETVDKKNKRSTSTDRLHTNVLLSPEEVELVKLILAKPVLQDAAPDSATS